MKSKKIIQEAIDAVIATSDEFAWNKIVKGIVNGKYFVDDWYNTSDKEIELYCDSQEEDEITINCDVDYEINNYYPGDSETQWSPSSEPTYDVEQREIKLIVLTTKNDDELTIKPGHKYFEELSKYLVDFIPEEAWNSMVESHMEDYEDRMNAEHNDWLADFSQDRDF